MSAKKSTRNAFEENLRRLEKIVESLEEGTVPLDDAVNLYEEGIRLSRACADHLKDAELRIRKLTKNLDGQFELEDRNDE